MDTMRRDENAFGAWRVMAEAAANHPLGDSLDQAMGVDRDRITQFAGIPVAGYIPQRPAPEKQTSPTFSRSDDVRQVLRNPRQQPPQYLDEDLDCRNGLDWEYRNAGPSFNRRQPSHHQEYSTHRNDERQTPIPSQDESLRHLAEAIAGAIHSGGNNRQSRGSRGFRRPERYDGRQHWNDYLTHFEMCAELSGWSDREKATQLAASLDGQALQVLSNLPWGERLNFNHLVSALQNRFQNPHLQNLHRVQLSNRKRRENESMLQLGEDMKRLARLAYPLMTETVRDELTMEFFINSLDDVDTRWKIRQCRPKSTEEAVCYATELDSFLRMEKQKITKRVDRPHKTLRVVQSTECQEFEPEPMSEPHLCEPHFCEPEESSDEDELSDEAITEVIREIKKHMKFGRKKFQSRSSDKNPCFNCGKTGHWRNECSQPQTKPPCFNCGKTGHWSTECSEPLVTEPVFI